MSETYKVYYDNGRALYKLYVNSDALFMQWTSEDMLDNIKKSCLENGNITSHLDGVSWTLLFEHEYKPSPPHPKRESEEYSIQFWIKEFSHDETNRTYVNCIKQQIDDSENVHVSSDDIHLALIIVGSIIGGCTFISLLIYAILRLRKLLCCSKKYESINSTL